MLDLICRALLVLLSAAQVMCQAPADANCPVDSKNPNILTLMDSNGYKNLLGEVWTATNGDSSITTWAPGTGGNCQRTLQVCEARTMYFKANNWLFTQYIPRPQLEYDITIYINVTLRMTTSCSSQSMANCPRFLLVYNYISNQQQDVSVYTNSSKYTLLGNITSSSSNSPPITTTLNFTLKAGDSGLYLGFRDQGSCTMLNRVYVYNYQCPRKQIGLVNLPLTAAPVVKNTPMAILASCVAGGINTTSLSYQCSSGGVWSGSSTCICRAADGYRNVANRCEGCGAGLWLDSTSITCRACPANTMSSMSVTSVCPCRQGFFRAFNDLPSDNCTAPPHAASNVQVTQITVDSITVQWDYIPDLSERSDYYFTLQYKDGDMTQYIKAANIPNMAALTYTINNLSPYTIYEMQLITSNGVSDQDTADVFFRTVTFSCKTAEGVPGKIHDITISGRYVIWQPPAQSGGDITGYELLVLRGSQMTNKSVEGNFYYVRDADIPNGNGTIFVQVRAINLAGFGEWSAAHILGSSCIEASPVTLPGQLALQSSESCVMWPIPEGEVTQYYILYNNTTITLNYTTNWHCFELNQIQGTITAVQVRAVNSAGTGPYSSVYLKKPFHCQRPRVSSEPTLASPHAG